MFISLKRPSPALIVASVALVMAMSGGAYAATQSTTNQATSAVKAAPPAPTESSRFCTPTLCIDADPNSGGSGGWGYDAVHNKPVTELAVGKSYPFTVTVVQDGNPNANGSITLTWNPADFAGPTTGSDTGAQCATASTGNAVSCTYSDLSHQYKSDSFNFKTLRAALNAHVDVTVEVNGEESSAEFPVNIGS